MVKLIAMKNFKFILFLPVVLFLFSSCEDEKLSIDKGGIYGVVYTPNGQPLPNASVVINGKQNQTQISDENGNYRFSDLTVGNYTVNASTEQFSSPNINVSVFINQFVLQNITTDYNGMLSTNFIEFTNTDEITVGVTNILNETIDVKIDEGVNWLFTGTNILGLQPGETDYFTVDLSRQFLQSGENRTIITVTFEEDFGFDVIGSETVEVVAYK